MFNTFAPAMEDTTIHPLSLGHNTSGMLHNVISPPLMPSTEIPTLQSCWLSPPPAFYTCTHTMALLDCMHSYQSSQHKVHSSHN